MLKGLFRLINRIPGEKRFGIYRFLPIFFLTGAALEFAMIHWNPNGINFYATFKEKKAQKIAAEKYKIIKSIEEVV